jgi:steroid delta-isomerase-like uncharacterized protein
VSRVPVKSVDDLKSLMRRFVEEFQSQGEEAVADELLADTFRNHTAPPGMSPDKQGVKAYFAAFRRAVPDLRAQVHDMLVDGDKVVTRKTFHGTHTGEFMGLPATGNAISVDVIDIVRVRDGRFVEHWNVLDTLALMQQLGGVAPPAR